MNIPNSLTIFRILLIPVYIGLLVYERFDEALIVLLVAGITDALDGTIARAANQRTRLGAFLDPLADKLLLTSGFITLSSIHLIPSWVTIVVVSRDAMLLLGTAVAQFTEYTYRYCPNIPGQGDHFPATLLCIAGHFFELPSHGTRYVESTPDRYGWFHSLLRLSLSLPGVSPCRDVHFLIPFLVQPSVFPTASRRLCICLTGFRVASRLAK